MRGRLIAQLSIGFLSLATPSVVSSQICGVQCHNARPISIPLRDANGNLLATISFRDGEEGKREITFTDGSGKRINTLTEPQPPPPPAIINGANPLSGDPIPDEVGALPDLNSKDDGLADIQHLQDQVDILKRQVKKLTDRINAAAAK